RERFLVRVFPSPPILTEPAMTKTGEAARPLHEDPTESFSDWMRLHGKQLGLAAIAVAVFASAFILVRSSNDKKGASASRALSDAQRSVASGNLPLAAADLQKLVTQYGSTSAGNEGRLLLAQVYFQQNKIAEGMKVLDDVGSGGTTVASVHALRAAGLEQAAKPAEAAAEYLKAADATQMTSEREGYRADAARAYAVANKKDEALKIWETMAADPSSPLNAEAKLRIGELTAAVASK
ncbi:MAG: tetratricopeptide repeat protein, partial [Gemmatimonadaceae bacterium]